MNNNKVDLQIKNDKIFYDNIVKFIIKILTVLSNMMKSKNDKLSTIESLKYSAITIKYFETLRNRCCHGLSHFHNQLIDDLDV